MIGYGLANQQEALTIANQICSVVGNGSNDNAHKILIETAQQETKLGYYPDKFPYLHGIGLCQFDLIGFQDVKQRTRPRIVKTIKRNFKLNINDVRHRELAYSPFLSLLFCRLFYKLRPDPIPQKLHDRAKYWKKHYNTKIGKGSVEEYVKNALKIEIKYL